jgi:hypothetical protein
VAEIGSDLDVGAGSHRADFGGEAHLSRAAVDSGFVWVKIAASVLSKQY